MQLLKRLKTTVSPLRNRSARTTISTDQAYSILNNERRRMVIRYLADIEDTVSTRELSHHIAEVEEASRQTVYISLYQNHLGRLSDAGVIEYDAREGVCEPTQACHLVRRIDQYAQKLLRE